MHAWTSLIDRHFSVEVVKLEITNEMRGSSEANNKMTLQLRERLQYLEDSVNPSSSIVQKLSENEERCGTLQEALRGIIPTIESLNSSIKIMDGKEVSITQHMEQLGQSISEIKIPDKVELLPVEPCTHAKENIELQRQVQELASELKIAGESLKEKEKRNGETNNALLEAMSRVQEAETYTKKFESQNIELGDKLKLIENNVREELNRASVVARDEHKKQFEQQLHKVLREKTELENGLNSLQERLTQSQRELVFHSSQCLKRQLMTHRPKKKSPHRKSSPKLRLLYVTFIVVTKIAKLSSFRTRTVKSKPLRALLPNILRS